MTSAVKSKLSDCHQRVFSRARETAQGALSALVETWIQFLAPTLGLTGPCNTSFRNLTRIPPAPEGTSAYMVHTHTQSGTYTSNERKREEPLKEPFLNSHT